MPDRAVYDALATSYDRGMARVTALHARALVQAARVRTGGRVLDVAAGTGVVTEALAKRVGPAGIVVATDISAEMLNGAARRFRSGTAPAARLARMAAETPALADGVFDAATCGFGLQHMTEPDAALRAMRQALRSGGRCALTVWAPLGGRAQTPVDQAFATVTDSHESATHNEGFSAPGALSAALTRAGFVDVREALSQATLQTPDLEHWWGLITSGRLGNRVRALGRRDAARLKKLALANAEAYATYERKRWRFPAGAVLAVGRAP